MKTLRKRGVLKLKKGNTKKETKFSLKKKSKNEEIFYFRGAGPPQIDTDKFPAHFGTERVPKKRIKNKKKRNKKMTAPKKEIAAC